jgi:hypothetical protein
MTQSSRNLIRSGRRGHAAARRAGTLVAAAALAGLAACEPAGERAPDAPVDAAEVRVAEQHFQAEPQDSLIFVETMAWARSEGLAELPIGESIARLAERFVGEPYIPHTLELEGDERLVVNLRAFDCVTLIENVLAFARLLRDGDNSFASYRRELLRIRYRGGELEGYVSRLHYFSEWIADNEARGLLRDITAEIGGVVTDEPVDFMSRNPDAYRQLADPGVVDRVREIEDRLSRRTRYWIPQNRIAQIASQIRNGDIIAATSSIRGLDVAHTGFAFWRDGQLHLLHAPLVGSVVEISERPLAQRIVGISGQDGIMVARPL